MAGSRLSPEEGQTKRVNKRAPQPAAPPTLVVSPSAEAKGPQNFGRFVAIGALALGWCMLVFAAAVFLTRDTYGENTGKLIGTVFSGVAFFPAVRVFMNWYRRTEGTATQRRPAPEALLSRSTGTQPVEPTKLGE
jgi:hypothetical protein